MAQITVDLSGRGGLAPKFHGDVNDTSAKPHLRYLGDDDQFADGIYDPLRKYGYISPANATYAAITGSLNANIIATEYDSINDDAYFAEDGAVIWRLDGLADTSLAADTTVAQSGTETLTDLEIYEVNGTRCLYYAYNISGLAGGFSNIGVKGLDEDSGVYMVQSVSFPNDDVFGTITGAGSVQALTQGYQASTDISFNRVRLPLTKNATDNGGYTIGADIQGDTFNSKDGSTNFTVSAKQHLLITDAAQTGLDLTDDFTIEFWIKPNNGEVSSYVVSKTQILDYTDGSYGLKIQSGEITLDLIDAAGPTHTEITVPWPTLEDGQWVHVAVTRARVAGEVKFYVNGVQTGSTQAATTNTLQNTDCNFVIGATMGRSNTAIVPGVDDIVSFYAGYISDVRVWNDVRTATEIRQNFKNELVGNEANLVAYWKLDNDLSETLTEPDVTSNNNDLTANSSNIPLMVEGVIPPGRPDGVSAATGTILPSALSLAGSQEKHAMVNIDLNATVTMDEDEKFFIILKPTVFGDMGASDEFNWLGREGDPLANDYGNTYDGTYYATTDQNKDADFSLILTSTQVWASEFVSGPYKFDPAADIFMRRADNGYMYVFEDNHVHRVDGTLTGGVTGTLKQDVILFPSYFKCVDAVDARGRMYIAVQSNPNAGVSDARTYAEGVTGVYVWDRQSSVVGMRDFIPLYGVRDIKSLYVAPDGDIRAICIGDDRFVQIRSISAAAGKVIQTLGMSAYPETRDSVKSVNDMTTWLGADGIQYLHGPIQFGSKERLYKIGSVASQATGAFTTGSIFVGNSESSQSRQGILVAFRDTVTPQLKRWYPHGVGTINAVPQLGLIGDVYTKVTHLPPNSTIKSIDIYCIPTSSSGSTEVAKIKPYFNQSSTAWATKSIKQSDAKKGVYQIPVNLSYISSVQFEIEFSTAQTLGDDDFCPLVAIINYVPSKAVNKTAPAA